MKRLAQALPIAITCGDPSGVGPEIIEQILAGEPDLLEGAVLIGPADWLGRLAGVGPKQCLPVGPVGLQAVPGEPSLAGASVALAAMEAGARGCLEGRFAGVVTGPVSKFWLKQVGYAWPGQTEFFAEAWGGAPTMAFVGESLRVVLATWHIPLAAVPAALDAACLEVAVRRAALLGHHCGIESPRIGVCGLNPHAGEGGILGREELEVLDPALDRLRAEFPGLSKCLPGDTVFYRQRKGDFDVVVAAYHDQALAAVKTLEFDRAVNVTIGLPFLRTSPDHGTAFELAGTGKADASSFAAAIRVLREMLTAS